jgi:hypothetical protein
MRHGNFGFLYGCFSVVGGWVCFIGFSVSLVFFFDLFLFLFFPPVYGGEED